MEKEKKKAFFSFSLPIMGLSARTKGIFLYKILLLGIKRLYIS